jgi:uncharacterized protein (DUF1778 family)
MREATKKSQSNSKTEYLDIRLGSDEKQGFKEAAALAGLSLSTWVRIRLRQTAEQELRKYGKEVPFLS